MSETKPRRSPAGKSEVQPRKGGSKPAAPSASPLNPVQKPGNRPDLSLLAASADMALGRHWPRLRVPG